MSCAAFTILGIVGLALDKSKKWILWTTFGLAAMMLFLASFLTWHDQYHKAAVLESGQLNLHKTVDILTARVDEKQNQINQLLSQLSAKHEQAKVQVIPIPISTLRPLILLDTQAKMVTNQMKSFAGERMAIRVSKPNPEISRFANQLVKAVKDAGVHVQYERSAILVTRWGTLPTGLFLAFGNNRVSISNTLGVVLLQQGVIDKPIDAVQSTDPDDCVLYISGP